MKLPRAVLNTFLVLLSTLACGVSSQIPPEVLTSVPTFTPQTSTEVTEMIVIADTLHIRNAPNGQVLKPYLVRGQKVTILDREIKDGYEWCKIEAGWVACWWLMKTR